MLPLAVDLPGIINWSIPLLLSVCLTLSGYGLFDFGWKKGGQFDPAALERKESQRVFRVFGPVMLIVSTIGVLANLFRQSP